MKREIAAKTDTSAVSSKIGGRVTFVEYVR